MHRGHNEGSTGGKRRRSGPRRGCKIIWMFTLTRFSGRAVVHCLLDQTVTQQIQTIWHQQAKILASRFKPLLRSPQSHNTFYNSKKLERNNAVSSLGREYFFHTSSIQQFYIDIIIIKAQIVCCNLKKTTYPRGVGHRMAVRASWEL